MMRAALLWASKNPFLAETMPRMRFVQAAARRFMPGESVVAALDEAAVLQAGGTGVLLTYLGENIEAEEEAREVVEHYLGVMETVRDRGLDVEISVKPTHLGLDRSVSLAAGHLQELVCGAGGATVWVDMEASAYVDRTLEIYRSVRQDHSNLGLCLQAYLHRTSDDLESLLPLQPSIRLVKGAYLEPPEIAYPEKREVDDAFARLTTRLLQQSSLGRVGRVGLGTHDERMIDHAKTSAHELGLDPSAWEVEMLYGIAPGLRDRLLADGTQMRVLISYGSSWFSWYMRRLAERPANVLFVLKKMVGL